jgi:hypothetical protein
MSVMSVISVMSVMSAMTVMSCLSYHVVSVMSVLSVLSAMTCLSCHFMSSMSCLPCLSSLSCMNYYCYFSCFLPTLVFRCEEHLYKRLRLSVGRLVGWSVHPHDAITWKTSYVEIASRRGGGRGKLVTLRFNRT